MPVRHPILNGMGRLGLGEAAAKMIDALVDTIVKEQGGRYHEPPRDLKKKKKAKRRQQKQSRRKR